MPNETENAMQSIKGKLSLGQDAQYPETFDSSLLQPVPRSLNRDPLGITKDNLPFGGEDVWTCFELSWLNMNGVPRVAIAEVAVPVTTPNIIESKSFKLYLNGFNQFRATQSDVKQQLQHDLSQCAGKPVEVSLFTLEEYAKKGIELPPGESIDTYAEQIVDVSTYEYDKTLLKIADTRVVEETLYSNLLKSNCLITNQPDWGTLCIHYQGAQLDRITLLQYIISFRNHNEFHEQCVERIFQDILEVAQPDMLSVEARYTRRGGLDINPWRSTEHAALRMGRTVRQ